MIDIAKLAELCSGRQAACKRTEDKVIISILLSREERPPCHIFAHQFCPIAFIKLTTTGTAARKKTRTTLTRTHACTHVLLRCEMCRQASRGDFYTEFFGRKNDVRFDVFFCVLLFTPTAMHACAIARLCPEKRTCA